MKAEYAASPVLDRAADAAAQQATRKSRFGSGRTGGSMPVWNAKPAAQPASSPISSFAPSGDVKPDIKHEISSLSADKNSQQSRRRGAETGEYADVSFGDFVDIVNPLHHIPVVGNIYREVTGDEIKPPARVMGGALFGGPIGAASAMANVIIEDQTGMDFGENMVAMVNGEEAFTSVRGRSGAGANMGASEGANDAKNMDIAWLDEGLSGTQLAAFEADPSAAMAAYAKASGISGAEGVDSQTRLASLAQTVKDGNFDGGLVTMADDPAFENARAFAGFRSASADVQAARFGNGRTAGSMPVWSPKTIAMPARPEIVAHVDLESLPVREPVTKVAFRGL